MIALPKVPQRELSGPSLWIMIALPKVPRRELVVTPVHHPIEVMTQSVPWLYMLIP